MLEVGKTREQAGGGEIIYFTKAHRSRCRNGIYKIGNAWKGFLDGLASQDLGLVEGLSQT